MEQDNAVNPFVRSTWDFTITPCQGDTEQKTAYTLHGFVAGAKMVLGDFETWDAADEFVRRLEATQGYLHRLVELSTRHVGETGMRYLRIQAEAHRWAHPNLLFQVFRIPYTEAVGLRIDQMPWTAEHFAEHGLTIEAVRKYQAANGMPLYLIDLVHLAARANTRVLIFDPRAPVLKGLPIISED
jgi:hypothetical protein